MARLRAERFHRLRLYLEARAHDPRLRFTTWLRVVAMVLSDRGLCFTSEDRVLMVERR